MTIDPRVAQEAAFRARFNGAQDAPASTDEGEHTMDEWTALMNVVNPPAATHEHKLAAFARTSTAVCTECRTLVKRGT